MQQQEQAANEPQYVGLDVSQSTTSMCVVRQDGSVVWRGVCETDPRAIVEMLARRAPGCVRVGLETGQLSNWLTLSLGRLGAPVVCLCARHAKSVLKMQVNKSDAHDAEGLAHIVRTGWLREVVVKSMDAQTLRLLLVARAQLVGQRQSLANTVRGLLKSHGLKVAPGAKGLFAGRVRAAAEGNALLLAIVEPLLACWATIRVQLADYDRQLRARAKADPVTQRLMSVPSVGVVVALAYQAVIDDPARFKSSADVGAYLGLTPKRFQSGDVDWTGRISGCGDGLMRSYLYEAASVLLHRHTRPTPLKAWGLALVKRIGWRKAKVAVARKLAVLLHSLWRSGETFRWPEPALAA